MLRSMWHKNLASSSSPDEALADVVDLVPRLPRDAPRSIACGVETAGRRLERVGEPSEDCNVIVSRYEWRFLKWIFPRLYSRFIIRRMKGWQLREHGSVGNFLPFWIIKIHGKNQDEDTFILCIHTDWEIVMPLVNLDEVRVEEQNMLFTALEKAGRNPLA